MWRSLAIFALLSGSAWAQLPDAPEPQAPVHFWTIRADWQSPPLRSNRQVLKSWQFWAVHAAMYGAAIAAFRSKHAGEEVHSEVPVLVSLTALDFLTDRYLGEPYAVGPAIYATAHYARAAGKGQ